MGTPRKLEDVCRDLILLAGRGKVEGFFNNVENADKLGSMVEDIRDAMIEYQVSIPESPIHDTSDIFTRPHYSRISTTRAVGS